MEWKLNWPKTTDDYADDTHAVVPHEPAKEWRNL